MKASTVCTAFVLPVLLSFVTYVAYRHSLRSFPAHYYSLPSPPDLAPNSHLVNATIHNHVLLWGPEHLTHHPVGTWFITGCYDGQLVRIDPIWTSPSGIIATPLTYTGYVADLTSAIIPHCREPGYHWLCGRPLGLEFRDGDTLMIADAYHGLLQWDMKAYKFTSLWNDSQADTNSLAVSKDRSMLYFTSASSVYRNFEVLYSSVSGDCTGALLSYSFETGKVERLLDGLCFPNGVLVLDDDTTVIFAETNAASISSFHLPTRTRASLLPNLPCLPDNLHWDPASASLHPSSSYYWVGCGGPLRTSSRLSLYDLLGPYPWVRQLMMAALPWPGMVWLSRAVMPAALLLRVRVDRETGGHELADWWMDPTGKKLVSTTGAMWRKKDGRMYLSSWLKEWHHIASIPWAPPPLPPSKAAREEQQVNADEAR